MVFCWKTTHALFYSIQLENNAKWQVYPAALSSPSRQTHPRTSSLMLANQEAARGATPPRRLRRLPAALQLQPLPRAHPRRLLPTRNPGRRPSQRVGVLVCISGGALSPRPTRTDDDRRRVDSPQRPAPPGNGHAGGRSPRRAAPQRLGGRSG